MVKNSKEYRVKASKTPKKEASVTDSQVNPMDLLKGQKVSPIKLMKELKKMQSDGKMAEISQYIIEHPEASVNDVARHFIEQAQNDAKGKK